MPLSLVHLCIKSRCEASSREAGRQKTSGRSPFGLPPKIVPIFNCLGFLSLTKTGWAIISRGVNKETNMPDIQDLLDDIVLLREYLNRLNRILQDMADYIEVMEKYAKGDYDDEIASR